MARSSAIIATGDSTAMSLVGRTVGHVHIEALLGRGAMGEVYRGFDAALERPVALKSIRAEQRLTRRGARPVPA